MWSDDEVLAKAAAWRWTPFDAVVIESGGFTIDWELEVRSAGS